MNPIIIILLLFVIFYFLYFVIKKVNEKIIFQPTITEHDELDILMDDNKNIIKETFKTTDDIDLWGFLYNKNKIPSWDDNIIIYSHGNAGWIGYLIDSLTLNMLSKYGSVFVYDYRGYGISSGSPSEDGVYNDIMTVWNYLVNNKNVKPEKIIVYGHSLGCAISTKLIANLCNNEPKKLPKALILEAPFICMKKIAEKFIPNILTNIVVCDFNNETNIKDIKNKIPIYILHSKNDELIPFDHGNHLAEIAGREIIEIDGTHNYPLYNDKVFKILDDITK